MYKMELLSNKRLNNKVELKVSITNESDIIWNSGKSEGSVNLVSWRSGQDKNKMKRHYIFKDFKPGDNIEYTFLLYDPFYKYLKDNQIQIDLVEEKNKWFRDKFNEIAFNKKMVELIDYLPKKFPNIDKNSNKKSLLIETRNLDHNEFVIKNTIQKLGAGWGHIIYCHKNNYTQIKTICDDISTDIEIRLLDFELTRNSYNNLCLDIDFWNEINCEKVLVYQTDTFILKKFDDKFLKYDYLGANWGPSNHSNMIKKNLNLYFYLNFGNGGLSLRSMELIINALSDFKFKEKYLSIIGDKLFKMDKIPEDLFFSLYTYLNKYKFLEDNSKFSIELMEGLFEYLDIDELPFGFHKLDRFNQWGEVINKYIEI